MVFYYSFLFVQSSGRQQITKKLAAIKLKSINGISLSLRNFPQFVILPGFFGSRKTERERGEEVWRKEAEGLQVDGEERVAAKTQIEGLEKTF